MPALRQQTTTLTTLPTSQEKFDQQATAIRQRGVLGNKGRLRDLFDYLAARRDEDSPSEQLLAAEVFGKQDFSATADDASVRVYIHRLRKKLDDYYNSQDSKDGYRLVLPRGEYRLLLQECPLAATPRSRINSKTVRLGVLLITIALINILAWWLIWPKTATSTPAEKLNPIWSQLRSSNRPIAILIGDYYLFSEFDKTSAEPNSERLVRDFRINSSNDLDQWSRLEPEEFSHSQDIDLTYLPLSVAFALAKIVPLLHETGRPFRVTAISDANPSLLKNADVIYLGLISGMGFLQSIVFENTRYRPGASYDEIVNTDTGQRYFSGEASGRAERNVYRDYAYFNFTRTEKGVILTLTGLRDTGLRGLAETLSEPQLPKLFDQIGQKKRLEALFEVQGMQNASIKETLILAE